jgi:hypothetical protein
MALTFNVASDTWHLLSMWHPTHGTLLSNLFFLLLSTTVLKLSKKNKSFVDRTNQTGKELNYIKHT